MLLLLLPPEVGHSDVAGRQTESVLCGGVASVASEAGVSNLASFALALSSAQLGFIPLGGKDT